MIIEVDDKILSETGLTADEYCYLYYLNRDLLPHVDLVINVEKLIAKGFISDEEPARDSLLEKALELFEGAEWEKKFEEFWNTFPAAVDDPKVLGRKRPLRTGDTNSTQGRKVKAKYRLIARKHDKIMSGLRKQIANSDIRFMNNIDTWINRRIWEEFEDTEGNTVSADNSGGKTV